MSSNVIPLAGRSAVGRSFGAAWVALCLALAAHVADEALTDFLSFYNPTAAAIRERVPFLPLPTFTFKVWLTGLVLAVLLLLSLAKFAFSGARFMVPLAYVFGVLMLLNGLQHLIASVYMGKVMPGSYSSPLLLVCSGYLLTVVRRRNAG